MHAHNPAPLVNIQFIFVIAFSSLMSTVCIHNALRDHLMLSKGQTLVALLLESQELKVYMIHDGEIVSSRVQQILRHS